MAPKRRSTSSPPSGFLVIVGAAAWQRARAARCPASPSAYLHRRRSPSSSLTSLLRWEDIARGVGRRQMTYGSNTPCWSWWCSAILVGRQLPRRRATPSSGTSPRTSATASPTRRRRSCGGLKEDVKIVYFQRTARHGGARAGPHEGLPGALAPREGASSWTRCRARPGRRSYDVRGPLADPGGRAGRQARARQQRLRAGHHERAHQGHARRQEDGLLRGGRGRADIDDSGDARLLRRQGRARHETSTRRKKVAPGAREDGARGLHGAGGGRARRRTCCPQPWTRSRAYVKGGGKALRHGRARAEGDDAQPRRPAQGVEHRGGRRTWWWTSPAWASSSAPASSRPIAVEYPYHEITKDFRRDDRLPHGAQRAGGHGHASRASPPRTWWRPRPRPGRRRTSRSRRRSSSTRARTARGPVSLGAVATVTVAAPAAPSPAAVARPAASAAPSPAPTPRRPKREGRVVAFGDSRLREQRAASASRATRTSS